MKKLLSTSYGIIAMICAVELFFLCLCAIFIEVDTPEYQIIRQNRKHYLVFKDRTYLEEPPYFDGISPSLSFDSLGELYNDFQTGNFTEEEYRKLRKLDADKDGKFEMFDMNNLMIPFHTSSPLQIYHVGYQVGNLLFFFKSNISGCAFERTEQEYIDAQNEISNRPVVSTEYDEERHVTIYHMKDYNMVKDKFIMYSIEDNSKHMLVIEEYRVEDYLDDSALPFEIKCYLKYDGKYYVFSFYTPEELPTKEWFSQFTMIKARS